jgi:hypothetical protein
LEYCRPAAGTGAGIPMEMELPAEPMMMDMDMGMPEVYMEIFDLLKTIFNQH